MDNFLLYNTYINNFAAKKLRLKDYGIGYEELAIFDFARSYIASGKCEKTIKDSIDYYWISHRAIMSGLYLLNIKTKRSLFQKIDKLVEAELFERHPDCKTMGRSYYRMGKRYLDYVGERQEDRVEGDSLQP